ncbi:MAG: protein meaA [Rhodospirillaceae bacterium]|nr:protein meaA [Rhodospirillaceae bacterium]MCA8932787.1 protein meaA [Rhodospirillaceae bacterium]
MTETSAPKRDKPWLIRTYSGHSSAAASNALYRSNLAKGQTGLSVAFDLPTQTGYDADHPLAKGEVGKVGVPICSIADMETLFADIPLEKMNTSMTINATAPWLLALYVAVAQKRGVDVSTLQGTVQNDIVKEYLSRGTYIFPPAPSLRLTNDLIAYTLTEIPKWNPTNICSYHLQEAGATPVQEIAFALSTALAVLDSATEGGPVPKSALPLMVGRLSFFVNAGIRFIEECCKMRAFSEMWQRICRDRYGVTDEKLTRFRYGVQVNSLGLTESQAENNVQRIVLEMLGVALSKNARARAIQLPAWNEALGLPRPWDQQWSLRIQQVMALETDLLEYGDIFDGSHVIQAKVDALIAGAEAEMARIAEHGGIVRAVENGYVKRALVKSHAERMAAIERGDIKIVGINCFTETAPSPLTQGVDGGFMKVDPKAEIEQIERLNAFRQTRDVGEVMEAREKLRAAAAEGGSIMEASLACAHAGVTTGEWAETLRAVFGEYRAPTGVDQILASPKSDVLVRLREQIRSTGDALGRPLRLLIGKPGLDGHSNGAEQIAVRARDVGYEVIYEGIRLTPRAIAQTALEEGVHLIGLSVLSGSHLELVAQVRQELAALGLDNVPIVVGGIIPDDDAALIQSQGIAAVYTPKDADLNRIMAGMLDVVRTANGLEPCAVAA